MTQYPRHVFVCTSGKTCPRQGAGEFFDALRRAAKEAGITDRIRVNRAGCLAQCGYGPIAVVYPEGVWYAALRTADAARLVDEHLGAGRPIEELRHRPPGPGKQICPPGEERIPPRSAESDDDSP